MSDNESNREENYEVNSTNKSADESLYIRNVSADLRKETCSRPVQIRSFITSEQKADQTEKLDKNLEKMINNFRNVSNDHSEDDVKINVSKKNEKSSEQNEKTGCGLHYFIDLARRLLRKPKK